MTDRHETFKNEYRPPASDGYIYVSACQEKDADGIWRPSTFDDDELFHYHASPKTGIVISSSGRRYYEAIDHAPDVSLAMIALGMVPDYIEKILCVDRRGNEDVAPDFLDGFVEGGAVVLYDGQPGHQPYYTVYPQDAFYTYVDFTSGYHSEVRYSGSLDALDEDAWKRCHETYAAHQCLHMKELLETGSTVTRQAEELPEDASSLRDAVVKMSGNRIKAPDEIVNWAQLGVTALDYRIEEVKAHFADMGEGKRIMALNKCWDAAMSKQPHRNRKPKSVFYKWGIDTMIDAYDQGVPLDFIIAE